MDRRRALSQRPATSDGEYWFNFAFELTFSRCLVCWNPELLNATQIWALAFPMRFPEIQVWGHASTKLVSFRDRYNEQTTREAIDRVNRSISAWPTMSGEDEPMESFETVKKTYEKLSKGLHKIKSTAEAEGRYVMSIRTDFRSFIVIGLEPSTRRSKHCQY